MADTTEIAWADSTFNPWIGCTKVSPGCDHCYAEADFDLRKHRVRWGAGNPRSRTSAQNWNLPLRWERAHEAFFAEHGHRRRVFCASLSDVFDNEVPEHWRRDLFALIEKTPHLDWLLLTKRIGNAERLMRESCGFLEPSPGCFKPRPNVWIGSTIVNQDEADRDVPKLLMVPAVVRFLSCEPLLGLIDLTRLPTAYAGRARAFTTWDALRGKSTTEHPVLGGGGVTPGTIDWVIVGGESGRDARPVHPEWIRDLRDQCADAGVPFLFKQWGEFHPSSEHDDELHGCLDTPAAIHVDGERELRPMEAGYNIVCVPGWAGMCLIGKKAAGRLLDGREHNEFPEAV